ncbi:MAG: hypothetical protein ACI4EF_00305, partial [Coprococcus sp.]
MLRIMKGFLLWVLAIGISLMIKDIAIPNGLAEYVGMAGKSAYIYAGCFVIVLIFMLWYMRKNENRWLDIAAPAGVFALWGLIRHTTLYMGANGMLYSIAGEIKKVYGINYDIELPENIIASCIKETHLFIVALVMFSVIFLMERCDSMMLAAAFPVLFMVAGASINITSHTFALIAVAIVLVILRYLMVSRGRRTGIIPGVIMVALLAVCMLLAKWLSGPLYNIGMNGQEKLIELAEHIAGVTNNVTKGMGNKKKLSQYNTIDGEKVELTKEVVRTINLPEKPEGTFYYEMQIFNTYDKGTWSYDGRDYSYSPGSYVKLPETGLEELLNDMENLTFVI